MNPLLSRLQAYPFERLRRLFEGVVANPSLRPIGLGIGEPRHPTPSFIVDALAERAASGGLASYPATAGDPALRTAIAQWVLRRYGLELDAQRQVLPVNGSREALFALAQVVIDPSVMGAGAGGTPTGIEPGLGHRSGRRPLVVCPNPFYQIYEGAALLAGADVHFAACDPARHFAVDWAAVPEAVWQRTQLVYVCTPGNPAGAVMPLPDWQVLFELSDRHGFVIASDECYSEIWFDEPPLGGLEAAVRLGRADFRRLVSFTSLSKRSNVPGLRSGFVAGDADILAAFLLYRTYHGSAMGPAVQAASIAAWGDEAHVRDNRRLYREKFDAVLPVLAPVLDVARPDAGFYLWAGVGGCDRAFARDLFAQYNVTVLPGSFLARDVHGGNPGAGRVRLALVAEPAECIEAAERIAAFARQWQPSSEPVPA